MAEPLAEQFRDWVLDPARTNDELLPVVYLVYRGRVVWGWKHEKPIEMKHDERAAERNQRRMDPTVRPRIDREELEATVEMWAEVKELNPFYSDDRFVRDLSALRFFPHLESMHLNEVELPDLSPLAELRALKELALSEPARRAGGVTVDFAPLRGLPIESLNLSLRHPWIDFSFLDDLPNLRTLTLRTNVIALETARRLPAAETVMWHCDFHYKTPARSFRALPEMPRVRKLTVEAIADLSGIERLTELRNADLAGPFSDLEPVANLPEVTYLRLQGERFSDVAPLARMPRLRELLIVREVPFDLSPLTESASLREVRVERCDILQTELAALNAGLNPDDADFLADVPRALQPLRFLTYSPQHEELKTLRTQFPRDAEAEPRAVLRRTDPAFLAAEERWATRQLQRQLDALLGRGWGIADDSYLSLKRYPDVMRVKEVIQLLREFSAKCRYPREWMMSLEPHGDMSYEMERLRELDAEEKKTPRPWLASEFDAEQERQEHEHFQRGRQEEFERLEREYLAKLKEEQNLPADLDVLRPPSGSPPKAGGVAVAEERPGEDDDGDDQEEERPGFDPEDDDPEKGGLMEAPPGEKVDADLIEMLRVVFYLDEDILWATSHMVDGVAYLMGETPDDWHQLPEPIQERPRPLHS